MKKFLSISAIALAVILLFGCSKKDEDIVIENSNDCTMACTIIAPSKSAPQISSMELEGGMYYGNLNQKKEGTPDDWIHVLEGTRSSAWRSSKTGNNYECDCNQ